MPSGSGFILDIQVQPTSTGLSIYSPLFCPCISVVHYLQVLTCVGQLLNFEVTYTKALVCIKHLLVIIAALFQGSLLTLGE